MDCRPKESQTIWQTSHPFLWQVFLKYYHIERLWQILSSYGRHATKMQKLVRGFLARREAQCLWRQQKERAAATTIQAGRMIVVTLTSTASQFRFPWLFLAAFRSHQAQKLYKRLLEDRRRAAILIQTSMLSTICWWWPLLIVDACIFPQDYGRCWLYANKERGRKQPSAFKVVSSYTTPLNAQLATNKITLHEPACGKGSFREELYM